MQDGSESDFASLTTDLKYLTPTVSSGDGPACQKRPHMSKPLLGRSKALLLLLAARNFPAAFGKVKTAES